MSQMDLCCTTVRKQEYGKLSAMKISVIIVQHLYVRTSASPLAERFWRPHMGRYSKTSWRTRPCPVDRQTSHMTRLMDVLPAHQEDAIRHLTMRLWCVLMRQLTRKLPMMVSLSWPGGYKTFFMLNSTEQEISTAHKN